MIRKSFPKLIPSNQFLLKATSINVQGQNVNKKGLTGF